MEVDTYGSMKWTVSSFDDNRKIRRWAGRVWNDRRRLHEEKDSIEEIIEPI
jgi:hypothetical protein